MAYMIGAPMTPTTRPSRKVRRARLRDVFEIKSWSGALLRKVWA